LNVSDSGDVARTQQNHIHLLPIRGLQFREMRQWESFVQRTNDQRANPNLSERSHSLHSP